MLNDVGFGAAGLAGLLSFLSPCILPIVPFYLCYLAGQSFTAMSGGASGGEAKRALILSSILFSAGVVTVFVIMGASATFIGDLLRTHMEEARLIAALVVGALGLQFLGVYRLGFLQREARVQLGERRGGIWFAYLIGLAFAFGWTPCVGPVLAAILIAASGQDSALQGGLMLSVYGIGMTAPFIVAACFSGPFVRAAQRLRDWAPVVEKVTGGALVVLAILLAIDGVAEIAWWMLEIAPDIGTLM